MWSLQSCNLVLQISMFHFQTILFRSNVNYGLEVINQVSSISASRSSSGCHRATDVEIEMHTSSSHHTSLLPIDISLTNRSPNHAIDPSPPSPPSYPPPISFPYSVPPHQPKRQTTRLTSDRSTTPPSVPPHPSPLQPRTPRHTPPKASPRPPRAPWRKRQK